MPERHWIEELPPHAGETVCRARLGGDDPLERQDRVRRMRDGTG